MRRDGSASSPGLTPRERTASLPASASVPDAAGHFGPYGGTFVAEPAARARQAIEEPLAPYLPLFQGDPEYRFDVLEIRHALHEFVIDVDSLWRGARRLLSRKDEQHTWFLPLGCHVVERHVGRQVTWEIGFEEFGLLEQAIELVDARLAMGKDHLLQRWSPPVEDEDAETRMPTVMLMASDNTRDARTQMARLLQNMLFLLGRLGFANSMAADLTQPAPLPAA